MTQKPSPNSTKPPPTLARRLGDFLKARRQQLGLTRADLAASTGISVDTLAKYENSPQVPSAGKLAVLCLRLQIDPREALRFSLGEGEGEHVVKTNPSLWTDYDAFVKQLQQSNAPTIEQAFDLLSFMLSTMRASIRHGSKMLDQHQGNLNDLLNNALPAVAPDLARSVITDATVQEHLTPAAKAALAAEMKSGPDQSDPSRPNTNPPEVLPAPLTHRPKTQRTVTATKPAKPRGKQGRRAK